MTPPPLVAPPPASSQPPAVNVNGVWDGTYTRSGGSGTIRLLLNQSGSSVTGHDSITEDKERGGPIAATLAGNTLSFNLQFGVNCVRTASGTATIDGETMTGTFSGQGCDAGLITDGRMTLTIHRLPVPALLGTTWLGGSPGCVGNTPGIFGCNGWSWQFTEAGSNSTGEVDIGASVVEGPSGAGGSLIPESTGTLVGTLTMDFHCVGNPADCLPQYFCYVAYSIMLSGGCASRLSGTDDPTLKWPTLRRRERS